MTLLDWLRENSVTLTEFAHQAQISRVQYVWKYVKGTAIPSAPNMMKIFKATNGSVTPNDFYGLGTDNAQTVAAAQAATTPATPHEIAE